MPSEPVTASVWTRPRRRRGAQPTLGREQIVRAAVELLDSAGLDGLSMRRLGDRLGSGATSIYWHVANKDDLFELVTDEVMGEVVVPDVQEVGWRAAAAEFSRGVRSMILRHPWVLGILHMQPLLGPNALRMTDRAIAALAGAGFEVEEVAHVSTALISHAIGAATISVAQQAFLDRAGRSPSEIVEGMEPYLESLSTDYPHYHAWWAASRYGGYVTDFDKLRDDSFEFGLGRLLDGFGAWLDRRGRDT